MTVVNTPTIDRLNGERLFEALAHATNLLARRAPTINALNVFPVPDGDTGTNMLLTMRATLQAEWSSDLTVGTVAATVARAALMGARGNSGVILSQYLRGLARGLVGLADADALSVANALKIAATAARESTDRPVEGTMLTVACDAARVAIVCAESGGTCSDVLLAASQEARASVARTPDLLPLLRDAEVVDSGAMGLATILEGMAASLSGLPDSEDWSVDIAIPAAARIMPATFGFCTEFVMQGANLDLVEVRRWLHSVGDSVLAVADGDLLRVHVHTLRPDDVIAEAKRRATVERVKIENMTEQHGRLCAGATAERRTDRCALVVVSMGEGFARLFQSLGADSLVMGGQTLNPSVDELVRAVIAVGARDCILLPNNANVLATASQAQAVLDGRIAVVSTRDLAEGVAAALAFQPGRSLTENVQAMTDAVNGVKTALITRAVRASRLDGQRIRPGQVLGLVDERIVNSGDDVLSVVCDTLRTLQADSVEVITVYHGELVSTADAQELGARVQQFFPSQQVECVAGGQPHYLFLLACE